MAVLLSLPTSRHPPTSVLTAAMDFFRARGIVWAMITVTGTKAIAMATAMGMAARQRPAKITITDMHMMPM